MFKIIPSAFSIVMLAVGISACAAQANLPRTALAPGARVRLEWLRSNNARSVGTATEVDSAGFLFQPAGGDDSRQVQFSALNRLEISTGRKSNVAKGALFGVLGGAVAGYVAVSGQKTDLDPRPFGALAGGLGGGLIGLLIGNAATSERWAVIRLR